MKRLNKVGGTAQVVGPNVFCFFVDGCYQSFAETLGTARAHAPGTVAVSPSGRQWLAVGDDGQGNAAGWRFVSPYVDVNQAARVPVQVNATRKAEKIVVQVTAYVDYFVSVKGRKPSEVVLRREQLDAIGAIPGQTLCSVPVRAYS